MRWLALDVGSKRVGCAISDEGERVASRLPPLPFGGAEALARQVSQLAGERGVGGVVVGLPITSGGDSRGERRVASVVAALREVLDLPIELVDERGTTAEAQTLLRSMGVPSKRWEAVVDGIAASLVLESFLARRHGSGASPTGQRFRMSV